MTKNEILEYFKDINHAYNDCTRYDTLKRMLDELQEPCGDAISRNKVIVQLSHLLSDWDDDWNVAIRKCIETVKGVQPVTPAEKQEPCGDAISRAEVLSHTKTEWENGHEQPFDYVEVDVIKQLPPVTPQYTDIEIQKMQDLEFAEIQKAYEIGKAEGSEVLDKIRAEIIDINIVRDEYSQRQNDYCDGVEFAKRYVLQIIDKYKSESEVQDAGCD